MKTPEINQLNHPVDQATSTGWHRANWDHTMRAIAQLQAALRDFVHHREADDPAIRYLTDVLDDLPSDPTASLTPLPALDQLCQQFQLSPLERHILVLCAGVELSSLIPPLCALISGNPQQTQVTLGLVLALFPITTWEPFHPQSPLRRWHLIDLGGGTTLTTSPLRLDERILHYLLGGQHLDQRLHGLVTRRADLKALSNLLAQSHQDLAQQVAAIALSRSQRVVQLCGADAASNRAVVAKACIQAGLGLLVIAADALPTDLTSLDLIRCLCEREAILTHSALLLDCSALADGAMSGGVMSGETGTASIHRAIAHFVEGCQSPLMITSRDRHPTFSRSLITVDIAPLPPEEQRLIWQQSLGDLFHRLDGQIHQLVAYFNLSASAIESICAEIKESGDRPPTDADSATLPQRVWETCLSQSRPKMDDLAQFVNPVATWEDLVLPDAEKQVLQTIAAHVRQRAVVYEQWGFAGKSSRGLGISALFAGASGTGKTMAAEVLARDLHLNLYRIDLSSVVSKYIGETEKNLRRVFDAAETGGTILLFDEADALFGKRSDVKDSHDRYANMEVSYLLQRIEAYRGLAILTTNLKNALDQAFLRRIRFVVQFPFPDLAQRAEIWRRIFPKQTPVQDLAYDKLARLHVAGGNIRNIALNAAFLAADAGEPVQMKHILQSSQSEYIKLERPLTDAEVKGWVYKGA